MTNSQECREYAKDCIRIAQGMHAEDKQTLLKIAEAWEMRALELEKREKTLRENDLPMLTSEKTGSTAMRLRFCQPGLP
ncbi:MAG: hypothetical protein WBL77_23200 [Pseudolabrys sp.]